MKPVKASNETETSAPAVPAVATAPVITEPVKAPVPEAKAAPVKEETPAPKAAPAQEAPAKKAPAKAEKKAPAKADDLKAPESRKELDAIVKKQGVETALKALSKVKVVDLRALAREYNGEFGIAGREIRNANKKVLIEEFSKYFNK